VIVLFWILVFYTLGISHVRYSENFNYVFKKNVNFAFPQGWGFFTRNPREAHFEIYEIAKESGNISQLLHKNTSFKNLCGLSRNNRYIGYELSKLIGYIPKAAWKNRAGFVLTENLPDTTYTLEVNELLQTFDSDREYLFVQFKPIPYAWASQNQEQHRPYLAARIKIKKDK